MTVDALHGTMRSLEREPVARVHRHVDGSGPKTANVVAFAAARQLRAMWIDMTCGAVACGGPHYHDPARTLRPPMACGAARLCVSPLERIARETMLRDRIGGGRVCGSRCRWQTACWPRRARPRSRGTSRRPPKRAAHATDSACARDRTT